ncbi:MAG: DUF4162 domain-containing protein [Oscillospiraceae bacterium]
MSSHQMATVEEFCTDLTILDRSRTVLQGHLNDIKKGYGRVHLQLKTEEDAGPYIAESGAQIVTRKEFEYQLKVTGQEQANDLLARLTRAGVTVVLFNLREQSTSRDFRGNRGGESDSVTCPARASVYRFTLSQLLKSRANRVTLIIMVLLAAVSMPPTAFRAARRRRHRTPRVWRRCGWITARTWSWTSPATPIGRTRTLSSRRRGPDAVGDNHRR